ncbi:MAG: phosphoribosylformylglycinamidine synthase subunit PurL [Candidatus Omnitrophica bacterium]|nr:phosphoribosylformylglycinamidine synthase subunit PurL [Candidatus Omnitrophota bacterium]
MSDEIKITKEIIEKEGLTMEEYEKIKKLLGREPNYTELGLFSAMWSEHCSYKNSRPILKLFPTKGKQVIQGPGENAGIVDIGEGYGVAFKMESHNHPSAVEPYEASATGGGGCMRDIFTMGAKPVGLLGSLRLGRLTNEKVKWLFKEIGRGFSSYANVAEVPIVGGEIYFDESYEGNPLVNAMTVGILKHDEITRAKAAGIGNIVAMIGGDTGKDGVGGAAFASGGLEEGAQQDTSSVAIGDALMGLNLRKASLELIKSGVVVGMQDMGAAGLVCSTSETASKGNVGIEIDISKVRKRVPNMNAYEIMLSESQERMLVILEKDKIDEAREICSKHGVPLDIIGRVKEGNMLTVKEADTVVAEVPARLLTEEAPVYTREEREPDFSKFKLNLSEVRQPLDYNDVLTKLLNSPTIADKNSVYSKSDSKLFSDVVLKPGEADAAVIKVAGKRGFAATTNCNGTYCRLSPKLGGEIAVAESARNLVCVGAKPLGITDCLNFGNPTDPEVFWGFRKCCEGITEACKALDTPVVSGNVSFYNENPKGSVDPTPTIGMVGVVEDISKVITQDFKEEGDTILLLGETKEEIGGSEYLKIIHNLKKGDAPSLDLEKEKSLGNVVLDAIKQGLVQSAHDCSEGGLAIALTECCISNPDKKLGAKVNLASDNIREDALLFAETQSRVILSAKQDNTDKILQIAKDNKVSASIIGKVEGDKLIINELINICVSDLDNTWRTVIEGCLK